MFVLAVLSGTSGCVFQLPSPTGGGCLTFDQLGSLPTNASAGFTLVDTARYGCVSDCESVTGLAVAMSAFFDTAPRVG